MASNLLLEAADALLLETGGTDNLLLEEAVATVGGPLVGGRLANSRLLVGGRLVGN